MSIQDTFWKQFGPVLFGAPRAPETEAEWIAAGKQLRALTQLDALATRLEQATNRQNIPISAPTQRPQARQQHAEAGNVYYNDAGEACCPQHERPLKQGRWGYYCSCKSETGKNGYCDFRIKDI